MSTAAYCSVCRAYVWVAEDGSCEAGHPRPRLRDMYDAQPDKKTGRPKPRSVKPTRIKQPTSVPRVTFAPPAPRTVAPPTATPFAAPSVVPVADATVPASQPSHVAQAVEPSAPPVPAAAAHVAPAIDAPEPGAAHSGLGRLFGPPRGRHSAVVVDDPQRRAVLLMALALLVVAATLAAEIAMMGSATFDALQQPAVIALGR